MALSLGRLGPAKLLPALVSPNPECIFSVKVLGMGLSLQASAVSLASVGLRKWIDVSPSQVVNPCSISPFFGCERTVSLSPSHQGRSRGFARLFEWCIGTHSNCRCQSNELVSCGFIIHPDFPHDLGLYQVGLSFKAVSPKCSGRGCFSVNRQGKLPSQWPHCRF